MRMHRVRARAWLIVAVASTAFWGATGCAPYYLVESRMIESTREDNSSDVTASAAFRTGLPVRPRVVLQPPDACANESAASSDGSSQAGSQILRTACGVEMASLERALARSGYPVGSWKAIGQMVEKDDITPLAAAKALDAAVLFQVNSLERSLTNPARDMRWERRFYESNKKGKKGQVAAVVEARAISLDELAAAKEKELLPGARMSATVNANAVLVATGESIWFYEHTEVEPFDREQVALTLAQCGGSSCRVRIPKVKKAKQKKTTRYGSIEAVSSGKRDAAAEDALYHDLVNAAINDLVKQFSSRSQ